VTQPSAALFAMPEVDFGFDSIEDMAERLVALEKSGPPVVRVRYKGGDAWLVLGYENVSHLLSNDAKLPAGIFFRREFDTLGHSLLHMEGESHRVYKAVLGQPFAASAVKRLTAKTLVPVADSIIDDFGARRELDLNEEYGRRYGFSVMSAILGVPVPKAQERELMDLIVAMVQVKSPNTPAEARRARAFSAIEHANEIIRPVLAERRATPRDDMISLLVSADFNGHKLTEDEVLDFVRSTYLAGSDSTGLMLGNMMTGLLSRPGLKEDLLAHPEHRPAVVDELVRLEPVTGLLPRLTIADTEVAGITIPAGSQVLLDIPGANRNAKVFPDPDTLSLNRTQRAVSLSFGGGAHFCLGYHLAREELRVSVSRLLDRLPGLSLAGRRGFPGGSQIRFIPEGVRIKFDTILDGASIPYQPLHMTQQRDSPTVQ
jgi:cytochrome P450